MSKSAIKMKKSIIIALTLFIVISTVANSTAFSNKQIFKTEKIEKNDPEPVDKIIVAFKEVGGDVRWEKYVQDILGLPPFPIFLYIQLYEGGWVKTYSGEIYEYPEVKTIICKFFIGDCYPANEYHPPNQKLEELHGIAFGLELS